jgi:hypothetical protein
MPKSKQDDAALLRKLLHAAGILNVHGLITDYERRVVHARMLKWKAARAAPVRKPPHGKGVR